MHERVPSNKACHDGKPHSPLILFPEALRVRFAGNHIPSRKRRIRLTETVRISFPGRHIFMGLPQVHDQMLQLAAINVHRSSTTKMYIRDNEL